MVEFKEGDVVERIERFYMGMNVGDKGKISRVYESSVTIEGFGGGHSKESLKLIKRAPEGSKSSKPKPIIKHLVIQESCNNTLGTYDSYKEATSKVPDKGEVYDVYELVHVAKVENAPKVTRIKPVKTKKKASIKKK